ncbi:E3 ubiquitin-protein ligase dbl4 [Choanephora cucurbitarum]|uniref:E3 ubiquitin-protein ligase dbl4 n=1 Tax=Choanephora cucurbitarum TaxID=101091 RepID=A0A1C7NHK8_9FUNG|nr:E3 ubiquitin-protein ligase dbl4 [Choanephora cucurbitarum]
MCLSGEQKYLFIFHFLFGHAHPLAAHLQQQERAVRSGHADNVQKYIEGCSICFERKLDFCLEYCRDQFCTDCFQKYVTEVVNSSWGLSITKIRCPVCKVHISQQEWAKYVSEATIERYNKFNRPYRTFSRCCPYCETEMTPCESLRYSSCRSRFDATIFRDQEWRNSALPHLHHRLIEQLKSISNSKHQLEQVKLISCKILQLEVRPESWKKLQFDHILYFPDIQCSDCDQFFCLQCGEGTHKGLTCEANMKQRILWQQQINDNDVETLRWKLEFSRKCPCCSIMIHRDEGCNKVECTLCGFVFCWECRLPWSENCGYFICATNKRSNLNRLARDMLEGDLNRSELGVPDVNNIFI